MRSLLFLMLALVQFSPLHAQDLSGKWKGYFIPNNDPESRIYIYEVDIIENENHDLNVVTYTNLSGNFSAKAIATGFYSVNTKLVSINETKFEDINIVGDMQACLMMNFLTFTNNRGRGILQGTYISNNEKGTRDCGGGKVYLEKEGLIKKIANPVVKTGANNAIIKNAKTPIPSTSANKTTTAVVSKIPSAKVKSKEQSSNITTKPIVNKAAINAGNTNPTTTNSTKSKLSAPTSNSSLNTAKKEGATVKTSTPLNNTNALANTPVVKVADPIAINISTATKDSDTRKPNNEAKSESLTGNNNPGNNNDETLPWVLLGRENKLIKRVTTSSKKISLDLYDNGTIDNDTIIIYDNNKVIANLKRLSYKAIHVDLEFNTGQHDIIIVAHNMGSIPPNTALVVLNDANNRQEFFITTTNKVNAKFEFVYKPSD
ncbi:MAG: hypothetical protein LW602_04060 [Sediminibacterium sp.]|jgi:hypothetical protein|nr:hypothetical protein [Sediminibacterium sp.]